MKQSGYKRLEDRGTYLREYLEKRTNCPTQNLNELRHIVSHFMAQFKTRWENRTEHLTDSQQIMMSG